MTPMVIAGLALAGLATAAGATTAGLVLTTSGPFAESSHPAAVASATASAPTTPRPSSTPAAKLPGEAIIAPTNQFNFDSLPDVDEAGWQQLSTPAGTLSFRIPANWRYNSGPLTEPGGAVIGEWLSVWRDIPGGPPAEGQSKSGWIKVDVTAKTQAEPYTSLEPPLRQVALTTSTFLAVTAYQFGQSKIFPNSAGGIDFVPGGRGATHYIGGYGHVDLPSTAGDVALTLAIIQAMAVH